MLYVRLPALRPVASANVERPAVLGTCPWIQSQQCHAGALHVLVRPARTILLPIRRTDSDI